VRIGVSPQLTLEAAMLRRGAFREIAPDVSIAELVYVRLKGGEPPGEVHPIDLKKQSPDAAADAAYEKLKALVTRFDDEATPYRSLVLSMWKDRYGTYDELARVKEWSLLGGLEGDEE
jgi:ATP-dependent helicase/nuclease subunit B